MGDTTEVRNAVGGAVAIYNANLRSHRNASTAFSLAVQALIDVAKVDVHTARQALKEELHDVKV
jgi:hypothetical protein